MRALSPAKILAVWEVGRSQHELDRALTVLAAAAPELNRAELAALSIGERDRRLLELRERTFGPTLNGFAACPLCGERLEFRLQTSDLRTSPASVSDVLELPEDDLALRFRLPTSDDLAAVITTPDRHVARRTLTRRCLLKASRAGGAVEADDLPATALEQFNNCLSESDPQAEVFLDLQCPACAHRWQSLFDIVTYFWVELAAQAKRLLREVDALARAYGWCEADILALSAPRRQAYIELLGA